MYIFIANLFESDKANAGFEILLMLLVAFVLGYLLSWLINRTKWTSLEDKLRAQRDKLKNYNDLEDDNKDLLSQKAHLEKDLNAIKKNSAEQVEKMRSEKMGVQRDMEKLKSDVSTMFPEEEVLSLRRKITELESAEPVVETVQVSAGVNPEEVLKLKQRISSLEAQNKMLADQSKTGDSVDISGMVPVAELDKLRLRLNDLERQNDRLRTSSRGPSPELHRLRAENEELTLQKDRFLSEKLALEAQLGMSGQEAVKKAPVKKAVPKPKAEKPAAKKEEKPKAKTEKKKPAKKAAPKAKKEEKAPAKKATKKATKKDKAPLTSIIGNLSVSEANPDEKDDLKRISGVGPAIEKKLNDIGIYAFSQIKDFTVDDIQKVTDTIQFFPGRIERDDWKKQASELVAEKS